MWGGGCKKSFKKKQKLKKVGGGAEQCETTAKGPREQRCVELGEMGGEGRRWTTTWDENDRRGKGGGDTMERERGSLSAGGGDGGAVMGGGGLWVLGNNTTLNTHETYVAFVCTRDANGEL